MVTHAAQTARRGTMEHGGQGTNWLAPRFSGKSFCFTGKSEKGVEYLAKQVLPRVGASIREEVTTDLDYLIVGKVRGTSAAEKTVAKLAKQGARIEVLNEATLIQLMLPTREEALALIRQCDEATVQDFNRILGTYRYFGAAFDLSGVDLREATIKGIDLQGACLDGADLSRSKLTQVQFGKVANLTFDDATLSQCRLEIAGPCRFRNTRFDNVGLGGKFEDADFSGARFVSPQCFLRAAKGRFAGASFAGCRLGGSDLREADLTDADLSGCELLNAQLGRAKLVRARLTGASLVQIQASGADLSGADLKGADLLGAHLDGARIDDADFSGARVECVNWSNVDTSRGRNIAAAADCGPHLLAYDQAATKARPQLTFVLEADGIQVSVRVTSSTFDWTSPKQSFYYRTEAYSRALATIGQRWRHATLRMDSLAQHPYSSIQPIEPELGILAVKALCEAFHLPIPDDTTIALLTAPPEEFRARLLDELRSGAPGVDRWNRRSRAELARAGHFNGARLAGADLTGVTLDQIQFQEAVFDEARLGDARFNGTDLTGASFRGAHLERALLVSIKAGQSRFDRASLVKASLKEAVLSGASFESADLAGVCGWRADLHKANLTGANLTGADLSFSDLRGCVLTAARLDQAVLKDAKYDAHTVFPEGWKPPIEMQWAGSGANPFFDTSPAAATLTRVDFDTFIARARKNTQPIALYNAFKMLKSDRFQLYSDVGEQEVVGVVRSQSDRELVYSCRLTNEGAFSCCTQNLKACGGLRGKLCKHILVMVIGLTKAGRLAAEVADRWIEHSRRQRPILDKDRMSETFVRYKGAEAGELDWRPTETVPEDYLTL